MPTPRLAVFSLSRLRRSLSVFAEKRIAKRSRRASFSRNLSLLLMSSFFASLLGLAGCVFSPKPKLPEVVGETPTFEELQTVVNANGAKIETIFSSDASIGVASTPGWAKCQIAFERPGNLRVVGSAPTMGRVVDVGCNEERFWFWSDFQNPDELYFCRLDQYQNSAAARALPLDPTWFPEAFGVVELKEDELVDGPTPQEDGSLLVTLKKTRRDGVYLKRIYFEPKTAAILRQDVQAPSGEVVVSIRCRRSVYLDSPGVVLPQKIEIECPRTNDALIVDVGTPILNDSSKIAEKAFQQPTDLKARAIDLGAATSPSASADSPSASAPQNAPSANAVETDANVSNAADSSASNVPVGSPATFEAPPTQIRIVARARVDAVPQNALVASQTVAAAQTVATAQAAPTTQNAPTFQTPQVAQTAPTTQPKLLEAPTLDNFDVPLPEQSAPISQSASTLGDFDALLPLENAAPPLVDDFPSVDVPAPVGPQPEVVGAPRAAF